MTLASRRLSLVVALLCSTWLVAPLLDPQLHPWTSYASEYLVADRPAATMLRTTDGISGMLLIVMAVLSYSRARTLWRGLPGVLGAPETAPAHAASCAVGRAGVVRGAGRGGCGHGGGRHQSHDVRAPGLTRVRRRRGRGNAAAAAPHAYLSLIHI